MYIHINVQSRVGAGEIAVQRLIKNDCFPAESFDITITRHKMAKALTLLLVCISCLRQNRRKNEKKKNHIFIRLPILFVVIFLYSHWNKRREKKEERKKKKTNKHTHTRTREELLNHYVWSSAWPLHTFADFDFSSFGVMLTANRFFPSDSHSVLCFFLLFCYTSYIQFCIVLQRLLIFFSFFCYFDLLFFGFILCAQFFFLLLIIIIILLLLSLSCSFREYSQNKCRSCTTKIDMDVCFERAQTEPKKEREK